MKEMMAKGLKLFQVVWKAWKSNCQTEMPGPRPHRDNAESVIIPTSGRANHNKKELVFSSPALSLKSPNKQILK